MERKRSDSKSPQKRHSSEVITSSEDTSEELVNVDAYQIKHSRETVGANSRNEKTKNSETESKNLTLLKSHSSKSEGTSKQMVSNKKKGSKRILSSEDTSSDELVSTDVYQIKHCNANGAENSQKEGPKNSEKEGIKLTLSKVTKQAFSKKKDEKYSRQNKSSKREANEKIAFGEGTSGEFVNTGLSLVLHDHKYSRTVSENDRPKVAKKKLERKRPYSGLPRINVSKKAEVPKHRRCRERNASKNVNYCESSSPDELVRDDISQNHLHSHATGGDNRSKETPSSSTALSSKYMTESYNEISNSTNTSTEDSIINVTEIDTEDDTISNSNKFLKETPSSATLAGCPDVSKPADISPINFYGRVKLRQNLEGENKNGASTRKFPKTLSDEDKNKELEKAKAKYSQGNIKKTSNFQINNAEPGTSFHNASNPSESLPGASFRNERNPSDGEPGTSYHIEKNHLEGKPGSFSFHNEINNSEDEMKYQKDNSKVGENACANNAPKLDNNDNVQKESEKIEALKKQEKNMELSSPQNAAKAGYSIQIISQFKNEMGNKKDCSGNEDDEFTSNVQNAMNKDNVKKNSEEKMGQNKQPCNMKEPNRFKIDDSEPRSSLSLLYSSNKIHKTKKPIILSRGDLGYKQEIGHVEDSACAKSVNDNGVNEETNKFRVLKEKCEDSGTSGIDEAEAGQNRRNKVFKCSKPQRHSEGNMRHERDGTKSQDAASTLNSPKSVNRVKTLQKDSEKRKSLEKLSLEKQKESGRSKVDDADVADKMPVHGGSNENIVNINISPVTTQNKEVPKRRSDQSDPLKENRPRPSI